MNKEKLIKVINNMPDNFDLDVLIEKLIFVDKVEKGIVQLAFSNTIAQEQVKQKVKLFSSSS